MSVYYAAKRNETKSSLPRDLIVLRRVLCFALFCQTIYAFLSASYVKLFTFIRVHQISPLGWISVFRLGSLYEIYKSFKTLLHVLSVIIIIAMIYEYFL